MSLLCRAMTSIRIQIPFHFQTLAQAPAEVTVNLTTLEAMYPGLKGMVIDPHIGKRRPLVRFYVCQQDWTFEPSDKPLPEAIASGKDTFIIIGAISGG